MASMMATPDLPPDPKEWRREFLLRWQKLAQEKRKILLLQLETLETESRMIEEFLQREL